ncbi:hypothetical protein EGT74_06675 [Chitinophaga lutea]|uniref:Uncharacterized protein n=2 Tax=Chitinophaga lutea TaxID=2488634 RepID=A0A3N4Q1X4_9BACT|nr:hypothetical protein EGT74_06675 [Chitinophaga lutea]
MGDGTIPTDTAKKIAMPTLVMDGGKSFYFVHATADMLGKIIPVASRKTLKDQPHQAAAEAMAPVVKEFFA